MVHQGGYRPGEPPRFSPTAGCCLDEPPRFTLPGGRSNPCSSRHGTPPDDPGEPPRFASSAVPRTTAVRIRRRSHALAVIHRGSHLGSSRATLHRTTAVHPQQRTAACAEPPRLALSTGSVGARRESPTGPRGSGPGRPSTPGEPPRFASGGGRRGPLGDSPWFAPREQPGASLEPPRMCRSSLVVHDPARLRTGAPELLANHRGSLSAAAGLPSDRTAVVRPRRRSGSPTPGEPLRFTSGGRSQALSVIHRGSHLESQALLIEPLRFAPAADRRPPHRTAVVRPQRRTGSPVPTTAVRAQADDRALAPNHRGSHPERTRSPVPNHRGSSSEAIDAVALNHRDSRDASGSAGGGVRDLLGREVQSGTASHARLRRVRRPARPIRRPAARAARGGAGEAHGAAAANPTVAEPPAAARTGLLCTTLARGPSRYSFPPEAAAAAVGQPAVAAFFIRILPFLIEGFRGDTPSCSTSCRSVRSYCTYIKN